MSANDFPVAALAAPDAEASIIGALLLDNAAMDRVGDALKPSDFFDEVLGSVFGEMQRQFLACKPFDVVTVSHALSGHPSVTDLSAMAQFVPSSANLRRYVEMVRERSGSRSLLGVSDQLQLLAMDHGRPLDERIDVAQAELVKLLQDGDKADEWVGAAEGMVDHLQVLEDREQGKTTAMPTGLQDLDEMLEGGVRPGELIIVGARPSMGKTALAMTIGLNMAEAYSVAMLSMEMPHVELRDRMTAMLGRVSLSGVKRPARGLEWDRVVDGIERAKALSFHVSDMGGLNINQVRSKARNVKRLHGLNVLIVDYIGLMVGTDARQPRVYQLGEISRGLKTLAKELQCAVICLAQVNRKVEERADSAPSLSDLRDSGDIEQDADTVIFVHRPIQSKPDLGEEFKHYAKVSVAKNRNGRCGVMSLHYQGDQTRFGAWRGDAPMGRSVKQRGGDL